MNIFDLILLAIGVSMDAFAVSIAKGLVTQRLRPKHYASVALWFGGFQALMPVIGYFVGANFASVVESYDHWIAFVLLAIIGGKMLYDTFTGGDEEDSTGADFRFRTMLVLAVATSIDALAVGVALALDEAASGDINIFLTVTAIGVITCILSAIGVKIGNLFGKRFKKTAELAGGCILVLLAVKFLLEGLNVI